MVKKPVLAGIWQHNSHMCICLSELRPKSKNRKEGAVQQCNSAGNVRMSTPWATAPGGWRGSRKSGLLSVSLRCHVPSCVSSATPAWTDGFFTSSTCKPATPVGALPKEQWFAQKWGKFRCIGLWSNSLQRGSFLRDFQGCFWKFVTLPCDSGRGRCWMIMSVSRPDNNNYHLLRSNYIPSFFLSASIVLGLCSIP